MAPLADLVNHRLFDRGGTSLERKFDQEGDQRGSGDHKDDTSKTQGGLVHAEGGEGYEFKLYAGHPYDRGEELFISVGGMCDMCVCVYVCMYAGHPYDRG